MSFNAFRENKILAKISGFTVYVRTAKLFKSEHSLVACAISAETSGAGSGFCVLWNRK